MAGFLERTGLETLLLTSSAQLAAAFLQPVLAAPLRAPQTGRGWSENPWKEPVGAELAAGTDRVWRAEQRPSLGCRQPRRPRGPAGASVCAAPSPSRCQGHPEHVTHLIFRAARGAVSLPSPSPEGRERRASHPRDGAGFPVAGREPFPRQPGWGASPPQGLPGTEGGIWE